MVLLSRSFVVWTRQLGRPTLSLCCCAMLACAGAISARPALAGAGVEPLETDRVASGLNFPVFATYAPGDFTRLFILEKPGRIRILNLNTEVLNPVSFLDINSLVGGGSSSNDERGLLGLAFHPDYQNNGYFYVNYTNNSNDTTIRRYTVSADPDIADSSTGLTVLLIDQPFSNHNGGWIGFGPNDGYLYISTGDGGSSCDPGQRSQDITNQLLGKMLRIDVDANDAGNYGIPPDNPYVGITGDDEIWALGLRNAWRNSFDRETGDLYIADVGQFTWEEINFQPADSAGRENYGWDCTEGNACPAPGCAVGSCSCGSPALTAPFQVYSHGSGCSITGGYVYRGCDIPTLRGNYFYADFCSATIWSLEYDGVSISNFQNRTSELSPSNDGFTVNQISSFGEDASGELYIIDQGSGSSGQIFKVVPETPCADTDLNCDGMTDSADLALLLGVWNQPDPCGADLNHDGNVDSADLALLLGGWG